MSFSLFLALSVLFIVILIITSLLFRAHSLIFLLYILIPYSLLVIWPSHFNITTFFCYRTLFSTCNPLYFHGPAIASLTKYVHIKSTTVYAPRRNWDSPNPFLASECIPLPPETGGRGHTSLQLGGWGESQFRRGAYTVVLFICTYFVPSLKHRHNMKEIKPRK